MAIDIHVEDCNFHDNSSVIRNLYDQKTVNQLTMEIEQAEERTDDKSILEALDKLKTAIEINNKPRISKVISDFALQFSSNMFANIAGGALLTFIEGYLH